MLDQKTEQLSEPGTILAERFSDPEQNPTLKSSWPVRFQSFETQKELQFSIRLPNIESDLKLQSATYFSQDVIHKDRTYTYDVWSGAIEGAKEKGTFKLIRSKEGILGGDLNFNGTYYEIQSLNINEALLLEKQGVADQAYECGVKNETPDFQETINSSSSSPYCDTPELRCLKEWVFLCVTTSELYDSIYNVYYSAHGIHWLAQWQLFLDLGKGGLNFTQTLNNNNIPTNKITWYVSNLPVNAIPYTQSIGSDFNGFKSYVQANLSPIYNQDIAILQSHQNYGPLFGIASNIPVTDNGWNPNFGKYALVSYNSIGYPRYTFTHEMGHCLGARHDNDNSPFVICGRGMIFNTSVNDGRTVMAELDSTSFNQGKSRILYFSNPTQAYNGDTIGTVDRNNKIIVENFLCGNLNTTTAARPAANLSIINLQKNRNGVFPNPTSGIFLLPLQLGTQSFSIFDGQGRIIQNQKIAPDQVQQEVDISKQPNGLYFIRVEEGKAVKTLKILKNE
ncbi:MAG: hypothetical protein Sapg2KO_46460 [Saprospiraceae bacterium]